jgi:hypothetical protein
LQIILDIDNASEDTGKTITNVVNQLFGWFVSFYRLVKYAYHNKFTFGEFLTSATKKLMTQRNKTFFNMNTDKLSKIVNHIDLLERKIVLLNQKISEMEGMPKKKEVQTQTENDTDTDHTRVVHDQDLPELVTVKVI